MKYLQLLSIFIFLTANSFASTKSFPALSIYKGNKLLKKYPLNILKQKIPWKKVTLFDKVYKKKKTYLAFELRKFLQVVYGKHIKDGDFTEIIFEATDDYQAYAELETVLENGGYLVFKDINFPKWEPIGRRKMDPGPFYIVWSKPDQTTENSYPWPWGIENIRLVKFQDRYPKVYPAGVAKKSNIYKGFLTFKEQCFRCHALNQQGGKVGPDLNEPKNIFEYRSEKMVKEFILRPSTYRHTQMPDHDHLTNEEVNNILAFLKSKMK